MSASLADRHDPAPVLLREPRFTGRVWDVVTETFDLPGVGELARDFVDHPGAVAVLAIDDQDRVLLIQQYRHPIGTYEWEIPAGLRDVDGESDLACAQRELGEEADLSAATWHELSRYAASPGGMNEHLTIYLARDLTPVPEDTRHTRTGEEAILVHRWVPLDEVVDAVLTGAVQNATVKIAVLTAAVLRGRGWQGLSSVESTREDRAWPRP